MPLAKSQKTPSTWKSCLLSDTKEHLEDASHFLDTGNRRHFIIIKASILHSAHYVLSHGICFEAFWGIFGNHANGLLKSEQASFTRLFLGSCEIVFEQSVVRPAITPSPTR